jgi:hypothetical protein
LADRKAESVLPKLWVLAVIRDLVMIGGYTRTRLVLQYASNK